MGSTDQISKPGADKASDSQRSKTEATSQPMVSLAEMQKFADAIKANQLPESLKIDMQQFEARARKDGLTSEDVTRTYDSALSILDASKPHVVGEEQRKILVE